MPTPPKTAAAVSGVCTASSLKWLFDLRGELARRCQDEADGRWAREAELVRGAEEGGVEAEPREGHGGQL
jgi:hypothetical protein